MKKIPSRQFPVVYRQENGWFIATVPTLPGCHTQGKTLTQAQSRIKEAIEVYLDSLQARRQTTPTQNQQVFLSSVIIGQ